MANTWLRLWHDMPNDPKWRTISRLSGQPVALVQAAFLHLLVSASQNVTRGHADVTAEDLASALDVTEEQISSVLEAMQGRVLEGSKLTGWGKRQVKREDTGNPESRALSAAERKRRQREREKEETEKAERHAMSRNVTTDKDKDKDKDKDLKDKRSPPKPPKGRTMKTEFDPLPVELPVWLPTELWREWVEYRRQLKKPIATPQGVAGMLNKLEKFYQSGYPPEQVIRQSIENEWRGLFEPTSEVNRVPGNGESLAERQLRAGREQWLREQQEQYERGEYASMAPVGFDDQNLLEPLDYEKRQPAEPTMGNPNPNDDGCPAATCGDGMR